MASVLIPPPVPMPPRGEGIPVSLDEVLRADLPAGSGDPLRQLLLALATEVAALSARLHAGELPGSAGWPHPGSTIEALDGKGLRVTADALEAQAVGDGGQAGWILAIYGPEQPLAPAAALAAVYGAHTTLLLTVGRGTHLLRLHPPTGTFVLVEGGLRIPEGGARRDVFPPAPLAVLLLGILRHGGAVGPCALMLLRQGAPVAFLVEQAGGVAMDATSGSATPDADAESRRTLLSFGSPSALGSDTHPGEAPLFGHRGLFRP